MFYTSFANKTILGDAADALPCCGRSAPSASAHEEEEDGSGERSKREGSFSK